MRRKIAFLAIAAFCMLTVGSAFAQNAPAAAPAADDNLGKPKFSALMYLGYTSDTYAPTKLMNYFSLDRVYFTFGSQLWGPLSMSVTAEVGQTVQNTAAPAHSASRLEFLVKNAYLQYSQGFFDSGDLGKALTITFQAGIITLPGDAIVLGMQDMRWLRPDMTINNTAMVIGVNADTTADLGASISFKIFKYVTLTYAISHGEGYTGISGAWETWDGKQHDGVISVNPVMDLFINGWISYEDNGENQSKMYYGGGVAWKSELIKVGVNFNHIEFDVAAAGPTAKYNVIEGFFNLNLAPVINYGIFFVGRVGYGNQYRTGADHNLFVSGGVGYQFNKYIRVAVVHDAWLRNTTNKTIGMDDDMGKFSIKAEAKF